MRTARSSPCGARPAAWPTGTPVPPPYLRMVPDSPESPAAACRSGRFGRRRRPAGRAGGAPRAASTGRSPGSTAPPHLPSAGRRARGGEPGGAALARHPRTHRAASANGQSVRHLRIVP